MKKLIKSLIKIFFVVVMPVVSMALLFVTTLSKSAENPFPIAGIILIVMCTCILAIIVSKYLHYVHMLPKVDIEFLPLFGFGIGLDRGHNKKLVDIIVFIPFVSFEIKQH